MDGRRARLLLGVSEHAGTQEIRRGFRARVLACHPDRGGDRATFDLIMLAFETLQQVEVRPAPRPRDLLAARHFDAYDSPKRKLPKRQFSDLLRAAMERVA
jgi:hypothetical protein